MKLVICLVLCSVIALNKGVPIDTREDKTTPCTTAPTAPTTPTPTTTTPHEGSGSGSGIFFSDDEDLNDVANDEVVATNEIRKIAKQTLNNMEIPSVSRQLLQVRADDPCDGGALNNLPQLFVFVSAISIAWLLH